MPSEQRLHPLSVLFSLGGQLRSFALPGLLVLVTAGSVGWDWQVWTLPLLVPVALASIGEYISFRYRYEAHELVIRSGILFRNERHVPYARIQNIDGVQNVLHRLLGVVEVRVETGGGEKPEATLRVLPVAALEEMRRRVFAERERTAEAEAAPPAPAHTLLHLPPRELLLCGLIRNRGFVVLAAGFGLLVEAGVLDGWMDSLFDDKASRRGVARGVLAALSGRGSLPVGAIALVLATLAGLLVVARLISMVWSVVRLHDFRLTRVQEDLRTEFGLLTRVVATIPRRRIQTLTIREGPLHRLFGRVAVRVETAGGHGGEERKTRREWLAPILRRDALPGLLREVLPELDLAAAGWQGVDPRAFGRVLRRSAAVAALLALPFVLLLRWWDLVLLALLLAWAAVAARLSVRRLGWAVTDGAVLFRSGWIRRQVSVARFAKLQAVTLHESPFDRRAAMARVRVDTAGAGDTSHRVDIPYLSRETARGLYAVLAKQAEHTTFQW